jgi:hypothetical protein
MVSSGPMPEKLAPYPMLVGTAITGQRASPATTLANAPSMPATTTIARARWMRAKALNTRWMPATPTSYNRTARLPRICAVPAASSAIGRSAVPPLATSTNPCGPTR